MISAKQLQHDITEEKIRAVQDEEQKQTTSVASSRGPSPNRGTCKPDVEAVPDGSMSKQAWLEERNIDVSKQVKLQRLSHMRYQHPDLAEITKFLRDFGMKVVKKTETERWFAGYGPDQYVYYATLGPKKFLGGSFEVQSYHELERAVKLDDVRIISDGIEEMQHAPGGGYIVTLEDPEGFPLNLVYGQAPVQRAEKHPERLAYNDEHEKPRQRAFQRFEPGPAEVYKLGHYGLHVDDFPRTMAWYTTNFNMVPSDLLYAPDPNSTTGKQCQVALFAHINLDDTLTDHHTLFLTSAPPTASTTTSTTASMDGNVGDDTTEPDATNPNHQPKRTAHVHHSSFEVHDLDTQFLGHQWLAQKGRKPVWGVGRHILGSQLFDYWWDCHGFMVEHYTDGDLVNMSTPLGFGPASREGLSIWGPDVPAEFLD